MGADTFRQWSQGNSPAQAFLHAVRHAQHMHGHGGYTGTLAEKHDFISIAIQLDPKAPIEDRKKLAEHAAEEMISQGDLRIDNKWGPAGCLDAGDGWYLFFGWASS